MDLCSCMYVRNKVDSVALAVRKELSGLMLLAVRKEQSGLML